MDMVKCVASNSLVYKFGFIRVLFLSKNVLVSLNKVIILHTSKIKVLFHEFSNYGLYKCITDDKPMNDFHVSYYDSHHCRVLGQGHNLQ